MSRLLQQIKDSWLLLAFMVSVVTWYANTNAKLNALAMNDKAQDIKIEEMYALKTDIAVIKANVEFIKQQVR